MARPKLELNEQQIETLASIGCTVAEIAHVLECSKDTLERRYSENIDKGRSALNMSLRRKQLDVAMNGSVPMLIWLGKQLLGQTDRQSVEQTLKDDKPPEIVVTLGGPRQRQLDSGQARPTA